MKKVSMEQLDDLLKSIYYGESDAGVEGRPFSMYLHGCDKENAEFMTKTPESKFHIERDSIASTVVNGGRPSATVPAGGKDYRNCMEDYSFAGKGANLVLIMPDRIAIDRYCGAVDGQRGVTRGYGNHIELDYLFMAGTQILDKTIKESPRLTDIKNCFILGYYDHETQEFALNDNCLLFKNQAEFDEITKDIRELANKQYDHRIFLSSLKHAYMGGCENPVEAEKILKDPEQYELLRQKAHIAYLQSEEAKLDANVYNTDLLIDYDHTASSSILETLDSMASELAQESGNELIQDPTEN